ncbi:response regulator [Streptomyces sp. NPDC004008]
MSRMLVVEDDPSIVRALVINLQARRYEVHAAPDGATALSLAAVHRPDAVLLDLGLPDMEGVDVIRALRGWTRVPILVLSARQAAGEKVATLDAGADEYITKAFRHGRVADPAARRRPPLGPGTARPPDGPGHDRRLHHRPARQEGGTQRPADAAR